VTEPVSIVGPAVGDMLATDRVAAGERPTADNTRLRCSEALGCSRKIAFRILGLPKKPYTQTQLQAFDTGEAVHENVQRVLQQKYDARFEVPLSYRPRYDLSGHADAFYEMDGRRRVVEIKTMKDYPWKLAQKEGPKTEHVIQAALCGAAPQIDAAELHLLYIDKNDGALAEWLLDMDDPFTEKTPRQLAFEEIDRMEGVLADLDAGRLPWRIIPGYGVVKVPPAEGSKDDPWNCRYCAWQPICADLPSSRVPVENVCQLRAVEEF
jgi:CRISPR/Cas system-associated exonuclease Cas4 (RecB family)